MYQLPRTQPFVASGLRQYSLNIQVGLFGLILTAISTSLLGGSSLPSWSMTLTSKPGEGLPIEPGLTFNGGKLAQRRTVSVCPYPSRIVKPLLFSQVRMTSGLSGSPAPTQWRNALG